ncbi:MAG: peptide ABC transporter ATP-binding protein [Sulfobacillus acidophilus]|uniref:Peptide ABC transporter ATP-binding protein n=1 Tax=Sulfobacillus acidophilus TaxID=53633 RepID=A0A2T2WJI5_9FIRM|nr:MAG: peptide ABC transporter ATP-binding protein [Sulfobacillus acidophilus]
MTILTSSGVSRDFKVGGQPVFAPPRRLRALRDVSLTLERGDIVGVVGERGCGKSTLARIAAGPMASSRGQVWIDDNDLTKVSPAQARVLRRTVQIVHQDPYVALNPTMTVFQALAYPFKIHHMVPRAYVHARVVELLQMVGLNGSHLNKYPNELSGGQRPRVVLARAFTVAPEVIVADEAVSAIDVSMRQSILALMHRIHDENGTAYLFITHDLRLARYFAQKGSLAVMYAGRVVEYGPTEAINSAPRHPYTAILRQAVPDPDPEVMRATVRIPLRSAELPDLTQDERGCAFQARCPYAAVQCEEEIPVLRELDTNGRGPVWAACHRAEELELPREGAGEAPPTLASRERVSPV